jgi:predicted O-methyltransferase YrrM
MALQAAGIHSSVLILAGNCHVDDARNACVRTFLDETDCTDLVFIDADVEFEPAALVTLCSSKRPGIIGGVYPHRSQTSMSVPVRILPGAEMQEDGALEVEGLPTGFMRLPRDVLQYLAKEFLKYRDKDGNVTTEVFARAIDAEGYRVGGDIGMCLDWREAGGCVWALPELRLGHSGLTGRKGSMNSELRRIAGVTLEHVVDCIREDAYSGELLDEAYDAWNNPWAATVEVLGVAVEYAKRAKAPILEMGCGLSTLLMAAATDQTVYAIEHDGEFAEALDRHAKRCGLENIQILVTPWKDGWYQIPLGALPEKFAFALVDGPPLYMGSRREAFFDAFPNVPLVILDDQRRVPVPETYRTLHTDDRLRVVKSEAA